LEAGAGEPLLLLHGGHFGTSFNSNDWDLNIDSLAKIFHVFAIDKIGCGFTDNPKSDEEYVIGTMVQHAYDFLKTMKIDSSHLVGHSRGGYAVCRLALEHPEVVKTLVIVSSTTLMIPLCPIYAEWDRLAALITDIGDRHRYLVAANSFGSEHISDDFVDVMAEQSMLPKSQEAAAKMEAGLNSQFLADLAVKQKETQELIRAGKLKAPTLIMWGFDDPSATFDPVGLDTLRLILPHAPRSQMHILNQAGHYCYREQPGAFVAAVTIFIKSNSEVS
jgi:pimeloyl-ACP methyl ester carboxylesterase